MAQFKKFLSVALLTSLLVAGAAFAQEEGGNAGDNNNAQGQQEENPQAQGTNWGEWVSGKTNTVLNASEYACPFKYWSSEKYPTVRRLLATTTIVALVVTNPYVQGAVDTVLSPVKNVLGFGADEDDVDDEEPTRLTLGCKA